MKPVDPLTQRLVGLGCITEVKHWWRQTGTEDSEWGLTLINARKEQVKLGSHNVHKYLDCRPRFNAVVSVHDSCRVAVAEWKKYEVANRAEYNKYLKLKEKYE
jgi:hypothetical protein